MIPPPPFSAVSFESLFQETAEFLSEIKERFDLKSCALLKQVVGMIPPPPWQEHSLRAFHNRNALAFLQKRCRLKAAHKEVVG